MQRYKKEVKSEKSEVKSLENYILLSVGEKCKMIADK
jgi:hypothetical protein